MSGGIMFSRGDIVLIPFPFSDLTEAKRRPAVIISSSKLSGEDRICLLVTSNPSSGGTKIDTSDIASGSLHYESYVKPERVFTASTAIVLKRLCTLSDGFTDILVEQLNSYLH